MCTNMDKVSEAVKSRRLAIVFSHFLYHSLEKGYIDEQNVRYLRGSMPIVDNYGSVVTKRSQVLVPAKGSGSACWVQTLGALKATLNYQGIIYNLAVFPASIHLRTNSWLSSRPILDDMPNISPPNARFPIVASPLTKENALLLLKWIRNLRSGGVRLPSKFLDCVKI
jgi:hypothetical protein